MTSSAAKSKETTQQEICIDLPGESVQCWRSSDNIKIVLRKNRDVIFDLNLGKERTYTVHATESDFYNVRDKKLIHAKRKDTVTFHDGEKLHLWVTRYFKGALVLKSGDQILMKVTPSELDAQQYDNAPKTKPAPIIIAMGLPSPAASHLAQIKKNPSHFIAAPPTPAAAPIDEQCPIVCIVDVTPTGAPSIITAIAKSSDKSFFRDFDLSEIATKSWLCEQLAGGTAYVGDNWKWLRASIESRTGGGFKIVSAKIHQVRGKMRIYFSGYSQYNTVFGPGGFRPGHERTLNIFGGMGSTASTFSAVKNGVIGAFKNYALVSLIFSTAIAVSSWQDDIRTDSYDLVAALFMGVLKAIISAALTVAILVVIMLIVMMVAGASLPILAVGAATIAAGFLANFIVEGTDRKLGCSVGGQEHSGGLAPLLTPFLRQAGETIQSNWSILIRKYPWDYQEISF